MIPAMASAREMDTYVANIIRIWEQANADQMARGRAWYQTANDLATLMSEGNTRAGAGVIAALSPMTAWNQNVRMAEDAFANGEPRGHTRDALG